MLGTHLGAEREPHNNQAGAEQHPTRAKQELQSMCVVCAWYHAGFGREPHGSRAAPKREPNKSTGFEREPHGSRAARKREPNGAQRELTAGTFPPQLSARQRNESAPKNGTEIRPPNGSACGSPLDSPTSKSTTPPRFQDFGIHFNGILAPMGSNNGANRELENLTKLN